MVDRELRKGCAGGLAPILEVSIPAYTAGSTELNLIDWLRGYLLMATDTKRFVLKGLMPLTLAGKPILFPCPVYVGREYEDGKVSPNSGGGEPCTDRHRTADI
jgi:hypothetical protein